ncbi:ABC transporter permease [Georgenia sp. EYE_87]|uniref:ABC transporter permease n=1 Tax=Georgenia sp. EYE_87 TaxID=2853448 RepID=UPI00200622AF|nr:ABC transporter permease [Georgenia sp. EYE_87]MCK6211074.1 ABC transporter permease [Georgenia sp. EYE_87]
MSALRRVLMWIGLPVILIALWWAFTRQGANFFVPTPERVAEKFVETWLSSNLWTDVWPSVWRLLVSLAISIVVGVTFGILIGLSRNARWLLEPLLEFLRAIPSTILIPVLLLVIGINNGMKITVIVLGCVWPILLNTITGVRSMDEVQTSTVRVYGINGLDRLRYFILPSAAPQMLTGIRQSLAVGLILMVVSEMFAAQEGIGYQIINFQNRVAIPEMWSGILLLGIIGVLLAVAFQLIQKRILHWYFGLKEHSNDG